MCRNNSDPLLGAFLQLMAETGKELCVPSHGLGGVCVHVARQRCFYSKYYGVTLWYRSKCGFKWGCRVKLNPMDFWLCRYFLILEIWATNVLSCGEINFWSPELIHFILRFYHTVRRGCNTVALPFRVLGLKSCLRLSSVDFACSPWLSTKFQIHAC